jgi:hypothetical protein
MRAAGATHQPHLPNILRKLVLRFQPYLTATTKPLQVCTKTLLIFTFLAPFLKGKEILRDPLNDAFSTADDPDNVRIPCALSLLAYELYPNLLAILKHQKSMSLLQHKIPVLDCLISLHCHIPDFLRGLKRFEDEILPAL